MTGVLAPAAYLAWYRSRMDQQTGGTEQGLAETPTLSPAKMDKQCQVGRGWWARMPASTLQHTQHACVWAEREQPAPHIFTPGTREEMQKHLPPHPSSKQTMSSSRAPGRGWKTQAATRASTCPRHRGHAQLPTTGDKNKQQN